MTSCGQGNQRPVEAGDIELGSELLSSYTLVGERKDTALRICYAYRSKRVGLRSLFLGQKFSFAIKNRSCNESETNKTIDGILKEPLLSEPMIFDSSERVMMWFNQINTDTDGVLSNLCNNIIRGQVISNKLNSSPEKEVIVEFSVRTDTDHYTVIEAEKDSSGVFLVVKRTVYYVQTSNQSTPQVGDDYRIFQEQQCPDGSLNETEIIEQATNSYP